MELIIIEKNNFKYPAVLPEYTANCNLSSKQQCGRHSQSQLGNSRRQEAAKKLVTQRIKWAIILLFKMLFALCV